MSWQTLLKQKQGEIAEKWFDLALEDYPPPTLNFFKKEGDQFVNPIGTTLYRGIKELCEELSGEPDPGRIRAALEEIIKIRAIQDLPPSRALAFVLGLKRLLREELAEARQKGQISLTEQEQLDSRIDQLVLVSFDIYLACRERLHEIRLNEVKNRTCRLLERAHLVICDSPRDGSRDQGNDRPGETEG